MVQFFQKPCSTPAVWNLPLLPKGQSSCKPPSQSIISSLKSRREHYAIRLFSLEKHGSNFDVKLATACDVSTLLRDEVIRAKYYGFPSINTAAGIDIQGVIKGVQELCRHTQPAIFSMGEAWDLLYADLNVVGGVLVLVEWNGNSGEFSGTPDIISRLIHTCADLESTV
jgi:hypothetical protein